MLSSSPFHSTARANVLSSSPKPELTAKLAAHSPSKTPPLHRPHRPSLRTIYASVSAAPGISAPAAESISPQFTNSIVEAPARESSLKTSNNSSFVLQQDGNGPVRQPPPTGESDSSAASRSAGGKAASLMLQAGSHIMPHPDKVDKGGEDACFIADSQLSMGVADGVGGWAEVGVDAGLYAKKLMTEAKRAAEAGHHPHAVLRQAHANTQVQGSSTACVVRLDKTTLHTANLGDSGIIIIRDGKVVFQTPQQQHSFNFPYQMGSDEGVGDSPEMAEIFAPTVQPGDIVVAGTDGLFDNVFPEEIAVVATQCKKRGSTSQEAAQVMCMYARTRAADQNYASPFAYGAFQAGFPFLGGKMDDITVVVAYVVPSSKL